ncbi:hypothetical protein VOLCADRAFT_87764 [Volvox carteri f. nagariensis]|uniref:C2 domain-containing protein n=1 Tax=Volvox carteri f. nagariensis TaxID=3068 RepID=D8TM66_VOLCA|nr:uncharacterized protein VOLCADRAFT_87764 [Volvox carteri f. nagariensis]EFJ51448.1 hypothetical protein VOLCADRAFT_87764 [Volvox carteri f. nagariensis]|eukprot:XP_002947400.1 hypothetical protein VOLCADRAFT_87764 [Volvox carteri f. nagariensis]
MADDVKVIKADALLKGVKLTFHGQGPSDAPGAKGAATAWAPEPPHGSGASATKLVSSPAKGPAASPGGAAAAAADAAPPSAPSSLLESIAASLWDQYQSSEWLVPPGQPNDWRFTLAVCRSCLVAWFNPASTLPARLALTEAVGRAFGLDEGAVEQAVAEAIIINSQVPRQLAAQHAALLHQTFSVRQGSFPSESEGRAAYQAYRREAMVEAEELLQQQLGLPEFNGLLVVEVVGATGLNTRRAKAGARQLLPYAAVWLSDKSGSRRGDKLFTKRPVWIQQLPPLTVTNSEMELVVQVRCTSDRRPSRTDPLLGRVAVRLAGLMPGLTQQLDLRLYEQGKTQGAGGGVSGGGSGVRSDSGGGAGNGRSSRGKKGFICGCFGGGGSDEEGDVGEGRGRGGRGGGGSGGKHSDAAVRAAAAAPPAPPAVAGRIGSVDQLDDGDGAGGGRVVFDPSTSVTIGAQDRREMGLLTLMMRYLPERRERVRHLPAVGVRTVGGSVQQQGQEQQQSAANITTTNNINSNFYNGSNTTNNAASAAANIEDADAPAAGSGGGGGGGSTSLAAVAAGLRGQLAALHAPSSSSTMRRLRKLDDRSVDPLAVFDPSLDFHITFRKLAAALQALAGDVGGPGAAALQAVPDPGIPLTALGSLGQQLEDWGLEGPLLGSLLPAALGHAGLPLLLLFAKLFRVRPATQQVVGWVALLGAKLAEGAWRPDSREYLSALRRLWEPVLVMNSTGRLTLTETEGLTGVNAAFLKRACPLLGDHYEVMPGEQALRTAAERAAEQLEQDLRLQAAIPGLRSLTRTNCRIRYDALSDALETLFMYRPGSDKAASTALWGLEGAVNRLHTTMVRSSSPRFRAATAAAAGGDGGGASGQHPACSDDSDVSPVSANSSGGRQANLRRRCCTSGGEGGSDPRVVGAGSAGASGGGGRHGRPDGDEEEGSDAGGSGGGPVLFDFEAAMAEAMAEWAELGGEDLKRQLIRLLERDPLWPPPPPPPPAHAPTKGPQPNGAAAAYGPRNQEPRTGGGGVTSPSGPAAAAAAGGGGSAGSRTGRGLVCKALLGSGAVESAVELFRMLQVYLDVSVERALGGGDDRPRMMGPAICRSVVSCVRIYLYHCMRAWEEIILLRALPADGPGSAAAAAAGNRHGRTISDRFLYAIGVTGAAAAATAAAGASPLPPHVAVAAAGGGGGAGSGGLLGSFAVTLNAATGPEPRSGVNPPPHGGANSGGLAAMATERSLAAAVAAAGGRPHAAPVMPEYGVMPPPSGLGAAALAVAAAAAAAGAGGASYVFGSASQQQQQPAAAAAAAAAAGLVSPAKKGHRRAATATDIDTMTVKNSGLPSNAAAGTATPGGTPTAAAAAAAALPAATAMALASEPGLLACGLLILTRNTVAAVAEGAEALEETLGLLAAPKTAPPPAAPTAAAAVSAANRFTPQKGITSSAPPPAATAAATAAAAAAAPDFLTRAITELRHALGLASEQCLTSYHLALRSSLLRGLVAAMDPGGTRPPSRTALEGLLSALHDELIHVAGGVRQVAVAGAMVHSAWEAAEADVLREVLVSLQGAVTASGPPPTLGNPHDMFGEVVSEHLVPKERAAANKSAASASAATAASSSTKLAKNANTTGGSTGGGGVGGGGGGGPSPPSRGSPPALPPVLLTADSRAAATAYPSALLQCVAASTQDLRDMYQAQMSCLQKLDEPYAADEGGGGGGGGGLLGGAGGGWGREGCLYVTSRVLGFSTMLAGDLKGITDITHHIKLKTVREVARGEGPDTLLVLTHGGDLYHLYGFAAGERDRLWSLLNGTPTVSRVPYNHPGFPALTGGGGGTASHGNSPRRRMSYGGGQTPTGGANGSAGGGGVTPSGAATPPLGLPKPPSQPANLAAALLSAFTSSSASAVPAAATPSGAAAAAAAAAGVSSKLLKAGGPADTAAVAAAAAATTASGGGGGGASGLAAESGALPLLSTPCHLVNVLRNKEGTLHLYASRLEFVCVTDPGVSRSMPLADINNVSQRPAGWGGGSVLVLSLEGDKAPMILGGIGDAMLAALKQSISELCFANG